MSLKVYLQYLPTWCVDRGMFLETYTDQGPRGCGGCIASEDHEMQDMATFANWGVDYVKVDRFEGSTNLQLDCCLYSFCTAAIVMWNLSIGPNFEMQLMPQDVPWYSVS